MNISGLHAVQPHVRAGNRKPASPMKAAHNSPWTIVGQRGHLAITSSLHRQVTIQISLTHRNAVPTSHAHMLPRAAPALPPLSRAPPRLLLGASVVSCTRHWPGPNLVTRSEALKPSPPSQPGRELSLTPPSHSLTCASPSIYSEMLGYMH